MSVVLEEFDKAFPGKACGKGWGCDHCGGCYDTSVSIEDVKKFIDANYISSTDLDKKMKELAKTAKSVEYLDALQDIILWKIKT